MKRQGIGAAYLVEIISFASTRASRYPDRYILTWSHCKSIYKGSLNYQRAYSTRLTEAGQTGFRNSTAVKGDLVKESAKLRIPL